MRKPRPPYPAEYRRKIVALVRAGRNAHELANEFECSAQTIRNWVAQADGDAGKREDVLTSVLKAVTNSNQKKQREQMCVAAFFLGEWHLLQGHRSEAHSSLKRAERDCPKNYLEYFSASAELKRLSP